MSILPHGDKPLKHLMTILEFKITDSNGKIKYEEYDIKNTIHVDAELFMLSICFRTSAGIVVPSLYYAGLDSRTTISTADTLANLQNEPTNNGYARVSIGSSAGFTVALNGSSVYQATSSILSYSAVGGSYGPVRNLFLATTINNTGYLLASGALSAPQTLSSGQTISTKIGVALKDC